MKAVADLHTHSTYSDGRGTIAENVRAAKALGLEKYAITDHGPCNIGTGVRGEQKYGEIRASVDMLREKYSGVELLVGSEADIISLEGEIDLSDKVIDELDLLIVGLHPFVWPKTWKDGVDFVWSNQVFRMTRSQEDKVRTSNTKALVDAISRYPVDIVSHPNLGMPVDIREIGQACADHGTAYEINVGHRFQTVEEIREVAKTGTKFVVNSDAHFPASVGQLEFGVNLLEQAGIQPEQTLNLR
ncbi:MAG TPA: PHP domain-containing protein [Bacillota bacterium]|nr:PHP domain-containing protein [Bacillota bacterium]